MYIHLGALSNEVVDALARNLAPVPPIGLLGEGLGEKSVSMEALQLTNVVASLLVFELHRAALPGLFFLARHHGGRSRSIVFSSIMISRPPWHSSIAYAASFEETRLMSTIGVEVWVHACCVVSAKNRGAVIVFNPMASGSCASRILYC